MLAQTFGCCRFIYNWALRKKTESLGIVWFSSLPKDAKPSTVVVSKEGADRYFVSILVEDDIAHLPANDNAVGADLGLKDFVIFSTGETVGNPKFFHKDEKKLARVQRRH